MSQEDTILLQRILKQLERVNSELRGLGPLRSAISSASLSDKPAAVEAPAEDPGNPSPKHELDREKWVQWNRKRAGHLKCPLCEKIDFEPLEPVEIPRAGEDRPVPFVPMSCRNCGYTLLVMAEFLGLTFRP